MGVTGHGEQEFYPFMPSKIKQVIHSHDTEVKEDIQGKSVSLRLSSVHQLLGLLGILPDLVYAYLNMHKSINFYFYVFTEMVSFPLTINLEHNSVTVQKEMSLLFYGFTIIY